MAKSAWTTTGSGKLKRSPRHALERRGMGTLNNYFPIKKGNAVEQKNHLGVSAPIACEQLQVKSRQNSHSRTQLNMVKSAW
eukprot:1999839-Amphidinium_carterae.1